MSIQFWTEEAQATGDVSLHLCHTGAAAARRDLAEVTNVGLISSQIIMKAWGYPRAPGERVHYNTRVQRTPTVKQKGRSELQRREGTAERQAGG